LVPNDQVPWVDRLSKVPFWLHDAMERLGYKPQKGPHDGSKACLKQAIGKEQLKPRGENL